MFSKRKRIETIENDRECKIKECHTHPKDAYNRKVLMACR